LLSLIGIRDPNIGTHRKLIKEPENRSVLLEIVKGIEIRAPVVRKVSQDSQKISVIIVARLAPGTKTNKVDRFKRNKKRKVSQDSQKISVIIVARLASGTKT